MSFNPHRIGFHPTKKSTGKKVIHRSLPIQNVSTASCKHQKKYKTNICFWISVPISRSVLLPIRQDTALEDSRFRPRRTQRLTQRSVRVDSRCADLRVSPSHGADEEEPFACRWLPNCSSMFSTVFGSRFVKKNIHIIHISIPPHPT